MLNTHPGHHRPSRRLKAAGANIVFQEKISGTTVDRRELKKLLKKVVTGDTLLVTKLDRLCRNLKDLLVLLDDLETRDIHFRSLGEDWANSQSESGKLLLHVVAAVAQFVS